MLRHIYKNKLYTNIIKPLTKNMQMAFGLILNNLIIRYT